MDEVVPIIAELPHPSVDSQAFWEACNRGVLLFQRCSECAHLFYYPRRLCPACGGSQLSWEASRGLGRVYSFSEVRVAFQGPAWQSQLPYTVVLIDLDEGPRMLSRWVSPTGQPPRIGDRARLHFVQVQHQQLPFFSADSQENP